MGYVRYQAITSISMAIHYLDAKIRHKLPEHLPNIDDDVPFASSLNRVKVQRGELPKLSDFINSDDCIGKVTSKSITLYQVLILIFNVSM